MAVVLGVALCVGLWVSPDFGLAWDEPVQQRLGVQAWRYASGQAQGYLRNPDRIYGPAFEMALYAAERVLGAEDSRTRYLLRHALTFLTFWCGTVAFHALARRIFGCWRFGLLATLLLLLSPRLVADAFYNSKDLPFLSFFVVAVVTLFRFVDQPTPSRALQHAFACAAATDVRIMGLLLVPLTLLAVAAARREGSLQLAHHPRWRLASALLGVGYLGAVVLLWPYLWRQPARRFAESFLTMARFPWQESVLFMGARTPAPALPWFYAPVWIAISTPPTVLVFMAVGALAAVSDLRARRRGAGAAVTLAWAFLPLVAVIALRSVLYDGWRQMYFVYPAIVLLAARGAQAAWLLASDGVRPAWTRAIAGCALALLAGDAVATAGFVSRSHPYQHVYFNALAGDRASLDERFEVDYWGLSSRRLLEYVVATDLRPEISVFGVEPSIAGSAAILSGDERRRLRFVPDAQQADYVVTHRRHAPGALPGDEVFSVRVDGLRLGSVFRVPRSEPSASQP